MAIIRLLLLCGSATEKVQVLLYEDDVLPLANSLVSLQQIIKVVEKIIANYQT